MKKLLLSLMLLIAFVSLSAQPIPESVVKKYNLNKNSTFFQIQKAMNEYWTSLNVDHGYRMVNGVKTKVGGWKLYKRWENYWEQRVNLKTGEFPNGNSFDEYLKLNYSAENYSSDKSANWVNLGTSSSTGGYAGLGRINCIAFHPTDVNTIWVGSPSGGLWRTSNGGANWTIMNQSLPILGVSDIVIDRNNANNIYIATGDRDAGSMSTLNGGQAADNNSIGVYKSTNGGLNWSPAGINYTLSQNKIIYKLLIHPQNGQILYAATSDSLLKTTNGGTTWQTLYSSKFTDMKFKSNDPNVLFASNSFLDQIFLYKFVNDAVDTYQLITSNGYRAEIGVSIANPLIIYVLAATNAGSFGGIFKSTNAGVNYSRVDVNPPVGIMAYKTNGTGDSLTQGKYDLCIAVSPLEINTVFIGGITTWKSTNGGVNWQSNSSWSPDTSYNNNNYTRAVVHADKHALTYQNNTTLFEGNDGGIYKTTNGGTNWQDLSNGLNISQIYRIGVSQTNTNLVLTGLQDNGSKLFANPTWKDVYGGDGMECIVDHSNSNYMYVTYCDGEIYRNTDGFITFSTVQISDTIPGKPKGAWVTPYIMNPLNSSKLYAGYNRVWKTNNRGDTWYSGSQILSDTQKIRCLAIAPSDTSVLYAADPDRMWKTTNGGSTNWTAVPVPNLSYYITYIAVKNDDKNTLWITFGGYDANRVYQSSDGGENWTNISAGLPNIPVMSIVQYKSALGRVVLYVGTDRGVYVKDGNNNWVPFSSGLPNVVVTELDIYYNATGDKLRAGTFGRGLWETNISTTGIQNISSELPIEYSLGQNYPNPFNPVTKINFQMPSKGNVSLKVYNQLGQEVAVLADKFMNAGYYSADFDGSRLSSGVYFCKLITGNYTATKKMLLIK